MTDTREIPFEGCILLCERVKYGASNLSPGDTYIGKRNEGWKMSTVAGGRLWELTQTLGYVYGEGIIYPYDWSECWKVLKISSAREET